MPVNAIESNAAKSSSVCWSEERKAWLVGASNAMVYNIVGFWSLLNLEWNSGSIYLHTEYREQKK